MTAEHLPRIPSRLVRTACALCGVLLLPACAVHPPQLLTHAPPASAPAATAAPPLGAGENIRPRELRRSDSASISLIRIRDREAPHMHTRYDLTVVLVEGSGTLWLDGTPLPMRTGDVAFIPRGIPHWFVNESSTPAAALVTFAPPFTGPDQVPAGLGMAR